MILSLIDFVFYVVLGIIWSIVGGILYVIIDNATGVEIVGSFWARASHTAIRVSWGTLLAFLLIEIFL